MFSGIRRAFGSVLVKEKNQEIIVEGIPADVMLRDISKIWKTSKININLFNTVGRSTLSFNSFFAPDIVYMLDVMIQSRKTWTSLRVLNNIREEIIQNTYLRNTLPNPDIKGRLNFSKLSNMKLQPLPHQREYLDHYNTALDQYGLKGYLLAAAPGTGKTLLGLTLAECLEADLIVVVSPKIAVFEVWASTVRNKAYKTPQSNWVFAEGKPYNNERIAIFHYESLDKAVIMAKEGTLKGNKVCVILDESHNLNEISSLRTQLFIELCKRLNSQDTVWASGTAIKAMGSELIPLLRCVDPLFNADAEARFKKIFGKEASKGLDIVKQRMGLIAYVIEKKVLTLQDPIFKSIGVKTPDGNRFTLPEIRKVMEAFIAERVKYYQSRKSQDEAFFNKCIELHRQSFKGRADQVKFDEYYRNLKIVIKTADPRYCGDEIRATNAYEKKVLIPSLPQQYRNDFKDIKSIVKYVKLKIQGECLGRVLGRMRIECALSMVQHINFVDILETSLKKTVVFTSYVEALKAVETVCRGVGLKPILVYGATSSELTSSVAKFEKDQAINPLAATYQSLSTAVPLTMADTMILINSPFRSYILEQAVSRIHRLGQDSQTVIWQMYLDTGDIPNISTRSNEILQWSMQQVELILGISSPFQLEDIPGLEAHDESIEMDDNLMMFKTLQSGFDDYDIELSQESFGVSPSIKSHAPAYLNW